MNFKNYEDYKKKREDSIREAEKLLNDGNMEEYTKKTKEIETLDNDWENYKREKANIEALKASSGTINPIQMQNEFIKITENKKNEYRVAFMNYVLKGTEIPEKLINTDETTVTSDVGAVIPDTILDKIIEKMESIGGIYQKMTKTFFKGGVTVPTSTAKPVATWAAERGKTDEQKKAIKGIIFTYHKLKCVVSTSLTVENVTLDIFERTLVKNITEAMIRAIENAAFNGTGPENNEPEGILNATVPEGQTIEFPEGTDVTYKDLCRAEGVLPEAYDSSAEWYMRKKTFFEQIQGMTDNNGQPIAKINYGTAGKPEHYILGRKVNFVDYVPTFEKTVTEDRIFAAIYSFEDYLFNTNLQMNIKEYEDHDTDDQIKKAIMLADGKPADINSLVVLKIKNS